ncbi:hypothetical protein J3R83DRAFT_3253 [Lanmaoa asiatica]|nr:hypothetical protein J3R83DRAFT_3253 [Lanmaoa asiatica]
MSEHCKAQVRLRDDTHKPIFTSILRIPQWQTREGNPVEIDQRALIYKVLARYPGEFTCKNNIPILAVNIYNIFIIPVFRELLQNSDDAQASAVEIHFETATPREVGGGPPIPPDMKSSDIVRWTFKNDGKLFTREDWTRLAKIATGNPDPAKIGAFGVGFYSLFSVTDHPVVSSGGYGMEFHWKDDMDQLYVRQGDLPSEETPSPWTIFQVPLREPGQMPGVIDLMRFLATSITFMVHLKDVGVFLNEHCIGHIEKFPGMAKAVDLPVALERSSPSKMVVVDRLECHHFAIEAKTAIEIQEPPPTEVPESDGQCDLSTASQSLPQLDAASLPLRTGDPTRLYTAKLDLTVFTVEVDVNVNEKLSRNLIRCTAKKPPSRLTYSLVYTGKDEYDRSFVDREHQSLRSIFRGLRADLNGFVGHSTSQTTGIGGHMASHFIPTVERESIDLVPVTRLVWNRELLYVGGFLARTVYELELSAIQTSWEEATGSSDSLDLRPPLEFQDRLRERFIHVLKFFTFHHSTPSPSIAQRLQESFYACSGSPLRLLSSVGVRYASDIRSFDPLCNKFLKHVPMLSPKITEVAERIIDALPGKHKICTITLSDVLQDLRKHTLNEGELIACLQWQIHHSSTAGTAELLQVADFWDTGGTAIKLSSIQYFIDSNGLGAYIPPDGPLPASLISLEITKHFTPTHLASFGWQEFTIADWLRYISQPEIRAATPKYDFVQSIDWAECVLRSVSSAWSSSDEIRRLAKSVFANEKCIPIMHGLCRPEDSYLPSLDIPAFDYLHLPVVRFPSGRGISAEMQRLLIALGVQQHLPPRLLLKQMVETGKWETSDLIDYLVQVADTLSPAEISELKSSDAFAKEGAHKGTNKMRFRADELYPPIDNFRQLRLPLIEWKGRSEWQDTTPAAQLLYRLGLRHFPPLDVIMDLCSQDTTVGISALDYLCANLRSVYSGYNPDNFRHIAFVPAENTGGPRLEKLGDVFLDNKWKTLGFSVILYRLLENVLEELGVQRHPPPSLLLQLLKTEPPSNEKIAREWFEILSNHVSSFAQHELDSLSQSPIIPKTISGDRKWLTPVQCYLGKSTKHELYSELFHFVNFGTGAIQFLRACGAKNEPSEEDVATSLINDHERFYRLAGRERRFLQELRDLAARHTRISNDTISKMRFKPVLLGTRHDKTVNTRGWKNTWALWEPREIVIVDDIHTYQLFSDSIIAAPRDMPPELEQFYVLLGCKHLTTVVWDRCNASGEKEDTTMHSEFRALVPQRLRLFLHHYPRPQSETSVPRISSANDITVRVWDDLLVSKTLTIGNKKTTKERRVWATAQNEQGSIQLLLSRNAKRDMYDTPVTETDLDPTVACDQPTSNHSRLFGGRLRTIFVMHFVLYVVGIVSSIEPSGSATTILPPSPWDPRQVMPQSYIESTVKESIQACTSIQRMPLHHRSDADMIKFLNEGYCNVSERIENLRLRGQMENVNVYIGQVIARIAEIYGLPMETLRIFYDVTAGCIAFNCKSVLYLNLRYFEVWREYGFIRTANQVYDSLPSKKNRLPGRQERQPTTSSVIMVHFIPFLTFAHEIAHNVVPHHNSEHEFWFSAICESHMDEFSQLLGPASA